MSEQVLVASLHDVRLFSTFLRGISINAGLHASVSISNAGLEVTVDEAKTMLAVAYIPVAIFDEFDCIPGHEVNPGDTPHTTINVPLDTLNECLNIFGTAMSSSPSAFSERKKKRRQGSEDEDEGAGQSTHARNTSSRGNATIDQFFPIAGERRTGMRMSYQGSGHPLKLILAEDAAGPITTCEIRTMECEAISRFPFDHTRKVINIILQSSWLSNELGALDPSCNRLTFVGMPASSEMSHTELSNARRRPTLKLLAKATVSSTEIDFPGDALETFECGVPVRFTYRAAHIRSALRALQSSFMTCLRIDDEGLLSLQLMMTRDVTENNIIEFMCLPLDDLM